MGTSNHRNYRGDLMDKNLMKNFAYIITFTSPRIQSYLKKISETIISNIQEIRLRINSPIVIVTENGSSFLTDNGKLSLIASVNCIFPDRNEIYETLNKMCGYSMHSHYEDLLNGYITLPNGARVGVCGTAVFEKETVKGIDNITSVNIRIPRVVSGVANKIFDCCLFEQASNLIIAGAPSSGKTTMLRDIALQLASGRTGQYHKICVVDERKELFPDKISLNSMSHNLDALVGFPKAKGIQIAVRSMSPEYIVCDEIGGLDEVEKIIDGVNCGVNFILSIHAKTLDELKRKKSYQALVKCGDFSHTVMLGSSKSPCKIKGIYNSYEVINEDSFISNNCVDFIGISELKNKAN